MQTVDPEYLRFLWGMIALLLLAIAILAALLARRANLSFPRPGFRALQETLGLASLPRILFLPALLLWLAILVFLVTGLTLTMAEALILTLNADIDPLRNVSTTLRQLVFEFRLGLAPFSLAG